MKNFKYIIGLTVLITSCDCYQHKSGYVLDSRTKKPLDCVSYWKEGKQVFESTDSTGFFEFREISGGFSCPDVELNFSKDGYKMKNYRFKSHSKVDTIYLEELR